jgi:hypothetical protein
MSTLALRKPAAEARLRSENFVALVCLLYISACAALVHVHAGVVVYPLDDTYIHMALGRTLATTGVWGVQPSDWGAASSSPLYTLILAGLALLWPTSLLNFTFAPLILNMVVGVTLLYTLRRSASAMALLFIAGPLVALTLLGMEHLLHILLVLLLATRGIAALSQPRPRYVVLALLTAATVCCRYESVVVALLLCVISLMRRRWTLAALFPVASAIPLCAFGALWMAHGGWFEPNSLLIKAPAPHGSLHNIVDQIVRNIRLNCYRKSFPSTVTLVAITTITALETLGAVLASRSRREPPSAATLLGILAVASSVAQFVFGSVGWLYRYEAWLLTLNVIACLALLPGRAMVVILAVVLLPRAYMDTRDTQTAPTDRLYEHFAPADFVAKFYPYQTVAVNDLGIMAWFSHSTVLDIFGLGSNEPVAMRKANNYTADAIREWTEHRHVQVAILQACWSDISRITPRSWKLVETWQFPRNTVFYDRTVAFYAPTPASAVVLRRDLAAYQTPAAIRRTSLPMDAGGAARKAAMLCD